MTSGFYSILSLLCLNLYIRSRAAEFTFMLQRSSVPFPGIGELAQRGNAVFKRNDVGRGIGWI